MLQFKLRFPKMDHNGTNCFGLFARYSDELCGDRDDIRGGSRKNKRSSTGYNTRLKKSEPLDQILKEIENPDVILKKLEHSGKESEFLSRLEAAVRRLRRWTYLLYKGLQPGGDYSVTHEQAKKLLHQVERNLGLALERVEKSGGRQGLYVLVRLFEHLDPIALNIERTLTILYEKEDLKREGEPGHFLTKLWQVIMNVLRED